jgi:putative endonuclease
VYILSSPSHVLYTGVTNDLTRRVFEHRRKLVPGFTHRYNVTRLVFFEETSDVRAAIVREKEIKAWRRSKKVALVEGANPRWLDLAADWCEDEIPPRQTRRNDRQADCPAPSVSHVIPSEARNRAPASVTDEIPRRSAPRNDRELRT